MGISTPSTFVLHSPAVGLVLTALFVPVLLVAFDKRKEEDSTQLNLSYKTLFAFLVLHSASWNLYVLVFPDVALSPASILGAFLIPLLILLFVYGIPLKKLGFTGGDSRNIIGSLVISLVYGILVFVVMGYINLLDAVYWLSDNGFNVADSLNLLPQVVLYSIPVLTLVASIPEEFLYRAVIQTTLTDRLGTTRGILLASLVFGMMHTTPSFWIFFSISGSFEASLFQAVIISFLCQAQVGIVFGTAWERTRSLVLPICLHTAHNVAETIPFFLFLMMGIPA
jgi:membrane protease YdiL (CAAX protease family)